MYWTNNIHTIMYHQLSNKIEKLTYLIHTLYLPPTLVATTINPLTFALAKKKRDIK